MTTERRKQQGYSAAEVIDAMRKRYAVVEQSTAGAQRGSPLESFIGLAARDRPPPTDEEVKQWIDEYRMEKCGR